MSVGSPCGDDQRNTWLTASDRAGRTADVRHDRKGRDFVIRGCEKGQGFLKGGRISHGPSLPYQP